MSNEIINNSAVNNVNNLESSVPKSGTFTGDFAHGQKKLAVDVQLQQKKIPIDFPIRKRNIFF